MTDKQIIIDGVDVSECEWTREVGLDSEYICTCNSPNKTSGYCKYNPNCYYKQLKRKEQECERTKERLESFQKDYSKLYQVVENKGYIKELDQLKETNDGLLKVQYKLADSNKKLRQTIEKIKGICEFDFTMSKTNLLAKSILQICDEVNKDDSIEDDLSGHWLFDKERNEKKEE